jgi:alpha-galactosidase
MGWNSWDSGIDLTEPNVEAVIDAMVASGMREAGYRYVNLDAGWAAPTRDSRGHLHADPSRFPNGIEALARYAHDRGMRLGIYASPYNEGCSAQSALASVGHEDTDAADFASWGVDFVKYDWCRTQTDHDTEVAVFNRMGDALRATGRPIVYSINPNSDGDHTAGARYDWSGVADMARTGADLVPVWREEIPPLGPLDPFTLQTYLGVADAFAEAMRAVRPSRPGFWADPDMVVAGMRWDQYVAAHFTGMYTAITLGDVPSDQRAAVNQIAALPEDQVHQRLVSQPNLTDGEQRAHLSLWAMLSAPLIIGTDPRTMTSSTREMLTNRDVIAVDQDSAASPPKSIGSDGHVLVKALSDGAIAVTVLNTGDAPSEARVSAGAAGLPDVSCYTVRDLWTHDNRNSSGDEIIAGPVPAHSLRMLRVTPACG